MLFYKDKHAKLEVYNDADGELVNLILRFPSVSKKIKPVPKENHRHGLYYYRKTAPQTQAATPTTRKISPTANFFLHLSINARCSLVMFIIG